jgi:hypothetical protein
MSRTSEPLTPAFDTARQAMVSRSCASMNETLFAIGSRTMVECAADDLTVPAGEPEAVAAPPQVRPREIAHGLNRDGISPPRGIRWSASTINGNKT